MASDLTLLLGTAATVAFVHTVLGPDHYVPFVAMASSGRWSITKTTVITILCGIGHILGSVVLAGIGVAIGLAVGRLKVIDSVRGEITAWLLMGFGFTVLRLGASQGHTREAAYSHSCSWARGAPLARAFAPGRAYACP